MSYRDILNDFIYIGKLEIIGVAQIMSYLSQQNKMLIEITLED
jgi:hypothetical protein